MVLLKFFSYFWDRSPSSPLIAPPRYENKDFFSRFVPPHPSQGTRLAATGLAASECTLLGLVPVSAEGYAELLC